MEAEVKDFSSQRQLMPMIPHITHTSKEEDYGHYQ